MNDTLPGASRAHRTPRLDAATLKRRHGVADVVASYGIVLSRAGRALVGRCPFHLDRGRPNLHVYAQSHRWYCYRCAIGGDVLDFVERIEGVDFREAARILGGERSTSCRPVSPARDASGVEPPPSRPPRERSQPSRDPAERACLAAAVELYANRLLADAPALGYVERRGLDRATLERFRVGYAAGDELADLLRWRGLPAAAGVRAGLLLRDGTERFAGRVVVPELRAGAPVWMVGRTVEAGVSAPKYLGLPGAKPLMGWEHARRSEDVVVVEGVFDLLTLNMWGVPALAVVGTHPSRAGLEDLRRFRRIYVALDADAAGQEATSALVGRLGAQAVPLDFLATRGVKDVADLATQPDGRDAFLAALAVAAGPDRDPVPHRVPAPQHGPGTRDVSMHDTSKGARSR